jgi:hypothetical protein
MDEKLDRYFAFEGDSQAAPCLLPDPCTLSDRQAVEMWTGFLYGQPMWTLRDRDSIKADFQALIAVQGFSYNYTHYFAQDAALDAIRVMLDGHSDVLGDLLPTLIELYCKFRFQTLANMLMDFAVFRGSADENERWAQWAVSDDDDDDGDSGKMFGLKNAVFSRLQLKVTLERDGGGPPRLMLPCLYHSHLATERPCYLGAKTDLSGGDASNPGVLPGHPTHE